LNDLATEKSFALFGIPIADLRCLNLSRFKRGIIMVNSQKKNQGRNKLSEESESVRVNIYMTEDDRDKLDSIRGVLGRSAFIRKLIDEYKEDFPF
jgi:hypothetical protein